MQRDNPVFGDFLISESMLDYGTAGAWILKNPVGVIGIGDHLSMCLADKVEVGLDLLGAIAELAAVTRVIADVRVQWQPANWMGPQCPEWDHHVRFSQTVLGVAKKMQVEMDSDITPVLDTLAKVKKMLKVKP